MLVKRGCKKALIVFLVLFFLLGVQFVIAQDVEDVQNIQDIQDIQKACGSLALEVRNDCEEKAESWQGTIYWKMIV